MTDESAGVSSLSPTDAGPQVAQQIDAPDTPIARMTAREASARIDQLISDPQFREKFYSGASDAKKEFHELVAIKAAGDRLAPLLEFEAAALPSGETLTNGQLSSRDLLGAVLQMRELGLSDQVIRQAVDGAEVSPREVEMARQLKAERFSDRAWVAKLQAGDIATKREWTLLNIILSNAEVIT